MKNRVIGALAMLCIGVVVLAITLTSAAGQTVANLPRTADKKPDLNGLWQAMNTAHWDIQDHSARQGPVIALGAAYSVPAGMGVVVGNEIPYKPEALARKKENQAKALTLDPEIKCYMPGVPRATYMPYPFHIVQTPSVVMFAYEFAGAARTVYINGKEEPPVDSWMGWSNGRWDGDTLVVDTTGFNGQSWFDRAGNYQTETLHVVERYTPMTRDVLNYELTIEDPAIYTRPWKMQMPLYRRMERNAQLMEYKCVEFAEETLYGTLKKPGTN
jgi:hypothetical protein